MTQFRNYGHDSFTFPENVTGFCGKNGSGKTNLLDAIYYICFTKSYFGKTDLQNTQQGKSGFRLSAGVTVDHKSKLIRAFKVTEEEIEVINERVKKEVDESVKFAEESPWPDDDELLKDIYIQKDYPFIMD